MTARSTFSGNTLGGLSLTRSVAALLDATFVTGNLAAGIEIANRAAILVLDSTIAGNAGYGLLVNTSSVSIRGATITSNESDGLHLLNQSVLSLVLSDVSSNESDGLHLEMSVASIRQNSLLDNTGFGVFIDGASLVTGYENEISGNGTDTSENVPAELTEPRQAGLGE
jgi:nitrous oxidase accessory protein NosD